MRIAPTGANAAFPEGNGALKRVVTILLCCGVIPGGGGGGGDADHNRGQSCCGIIDSDEVEIWRRRRRWRRGGCLRRTHCRNAPRTETRRALGKWEAEGNREEQGGEETGREGGNRLEVTGCEGRITARGVVLDERRDTGVPKRMTQVIGELYCKRTTKRSQVPCQDVIQSSQ